jgi:hypothetical protein
MMRAEGGAIMRAVLAASSVVAAGVLVACVPVQYTKTDLDGRVVCDTDRMDRIDHAARRENKEVHWVHCPLATLRVAS